MAAYSVTLATDDFSGSGGESGDLRYGCQTAGNTITFDTVSMGTGTVTLQAQLVVQVNNITIDASAAAEAVIIKNFGIRFQSDANDGTNDVEGAVVRGLRFREPSGGKDMLECYVHVKDMLVEYCDFYFAFTDAGDGCFDITEGCHDIEVRYCFFSQSNTKPGQSSGCMLIQFACWHINLHHNVFHDMHARTPSSGRRATDFGITGGDTMQSPHLDMRYNICWNIAISNEGFFFEEVDANVVCNLFGGQTRPMTEKDTSTGTGIQDSQMFINGNVSLTDPISSVYEDDVNFYGKHATYGSNEHVYADSVAGALWEDSDNAAIIAEWQDTIDNAGTIGYWADDATIGAARTAIDAIIPATTIFDNGPNDASYTPPYFATVTPGGAGIITNMMRRRGG